jgi:hypothetical protein
MIGNNIVQNVTSSSTPNTATKKFVIIGNNTTIGTTSIQAGIKLINISSGKPVTASTTTTSTPGSSVSNILTPINANRPSQQITMVNSHNQGVLNATQTAANTGSNNNSTTASTEQTSTISPADSLVSNGYETVQSSDSSNQLVEVSSSAVDGATTTVPVINMDTMITN